MSPPSEPHAFISYVREDGDLVDELESVLAEAGIPVWRDVNSLFPGDAWKAKIREAIQGDALAFIPVFSQRSEDRDKSQMREEIRLAIDEYRKMAPDRPWIFSVRLDDVQVPLTEISANQTLRDLNWTDFFGPRKTIHATRLMGRIKELLGEAGPTVADSAVVVASATDSARGGLLSGAIRDGLTDPSRAAVAGQLMVAEARRVSGALNDDKRFPMERPEGSVTAALFERAADLSSLIAPLVESAMELGARGRPEDAALATQLVSSLAREGFADRYGPHLEAFGRLRKFPALCVLVAGALGATATRNGQMLAAFAAEPHVQAFHRVMPVTTVLSPWDPFGPSWELAQFINATHGGGEVTDEVLNAYDAGRVHRTGAASASSIVSRVLSQPGEKFTVGAPEFDELFERTEVLIGAITNDWVLRQETDGWGTVENWIGNHTRNASVSVDTPLPERMLTELESAGENWWPLRGGGLFGGGDYATALDCMANFVEKTEGARKKSNERGGW